MVQRSFRFISFLILSMLWLASCEAGSTPTTVTAIPEKPTALAIIVTPLEVTASDTMLAMKTPTTTPPSNLNDQSQIKSEELIQAAEAGDMAAVQRLLKEGADINRHDSQGRTPVMAATQSNQVDMVQMLIQSGADINIRDNRMDNPFLYAGAEGLFEILKLTIDANADTRLTNRFGGTALIPAAERGHVEIVDELLTRTDVDVDHVNNLGWTALLEAIILGNGGEAHQQIVQLLVDHGADINIPDNDGVTPLDHAQARGFKEIESILTAALARDIQMISAAGQGDIETVKKMLEQGASVHTQNEMGMTALIAAAYRNDLATVDVLIQAGANVNTQDNTKQSAYLIATSDGYLGLLKRTLQAGADVHSTDSYYGTGLIRAADRGHVEIIQELLKTDIRVDHVNNLGWTALLEAIILGDGGPRHTEVVRLLVEAGADVNLTDGNGVTPLAHARQRGYGQITEILQNAGGR